MEPPHKKMRLSPSPSSKAEPTPSDQATTKKMDGTNRTVQSDTGLQPEREMEVGICQFVDSSHQGFTGILKQRYTDFLVHEIDTNGEVVHLTDDKAPKFKGSTAVSAPIETVKQAEPVAETVESDSLPTDTVSDVEVKDAAPVVTQTVDAPEITEASNSAGSPNISSEDDSLLTTYFGAEFKDKILDLYTRILAKPNAKRNTFGSIVSKSITDRVLRGKIHGDVRRIFDSRLDTEVIEASLIQISAAPPVKAHPEGYQRAQQTRYVGNLQNNRNQLRGKVGWAELGGEFLHFSLYKENKDTMEVISFLAKMLQTKPNEFAFAGTKDRRAVTVQRVSIRRRRADELAAQNRMLRQARIGNFKYEKHKLELGELDGNLFTITLRDCHFEGDSQLDEAARTILGDQVVGLAVEHLRSNGFINYFGLQRFGTYGIGTDEVGKRILNSDFKGAIDAILHCSEEALEVALAWTPENSQLNKVNQDDVNRTYGIHLFKTQADTMHNILDIIPRKFSSEHNIIRHLSGRGKETDYLGALNTINRNLKLMYVHAYQSLIWNMAASERWARHGGNVIPGDLVIVDSGKTAAAEEEVDENGEIIVRPSGDDYAITTDDIYLRARALSAEEAASGKFTISDIVLPTPGYDIEYPDNDIGDYYKEFMMSERGGGIDPGDMRRKVKDFSLSGSYRKLIGHVKDLSYEVKSYRNENEQLVETDLEKLMKSRPGHGQPRQQSAYGTQDGRERGGRGGRGRGGRGGRGGGRGGRELYNFHNSQRNDNPASTGRISESRGPRIYRDVRLEEAEEKTKEAEEQKTKETAAKMSAWGKLPEQLASEDKAAAEAFELAKAEPVNPDDIKQPVYKETFIQASVDDEGRRTGQRVTTIVGGDNTPLEIEQKKPSVAPRAIVSFDGIDERVDDEVREDESQESGGVKLDFTPQPTPNSPLKRPASEISISSKTSPAMGNAVPEVISELVSEAVPEPEVKIAIILKFVLGTSQYATMALRELMKSGGVKAYAPDFSMGR